MYYFAFLHRKRSSRCTSLSVSNLSRHTTDLSQRLRTITNAGFVGKTKRRTGRRKRTLPVTCASFTSVWPTLVNSGTCHKYPTLLQLCSRIYLNYAHSGKSLYCKGEIRSHACKATATVAYTTNKGDECTTPWFPYMHLSSLPLAQ